MEVTPVLLGKKKAAELLDVSVRTIDYLITANEIPTRKCGRRILIPYRALLDFARRDYPSRRLTASLGAQP